MAKEVTKRMNKGLDHTKNSFKNQKSEIENQKMKIDSEKLKIRKENQPDGGSRKTTRGCSVMHSENRTVRTAGLTRRGAGCTERSRGAGFSALSP